jgi:hypothetical protein
VNDFETKVKTLLNEDVDAQVGPRRTPPPFAPSPAAQRAARRWFGAERAPWGLPLLAAACVAGVAGVAVGAAALLADKHAAPPGTHNSGATTTAPQPTTSAPDLSGTVDLGGATLTLPSGWMARDYRRNATPNAPQVWCLTPASRSTAPGRCPMTFSTVDTQHAGLATEIEGGFVANPEYCGRESTGGETFAADTRDFGGRSAQWRRWVITCRPTPRTWRIEQYVVPTGPGFVLFSAQATGAVREAMTSIVGSAQLPAQVAPLRLTDVGYVRSVARRPDGVHITLDRVATDGGRKVINPSTRTYAYVVPTRQFDNGGYNGPLGVGSRVYIGSNGTRVTSIHQV